MTQIPYRGNSMTKFLNKPVEEVTIGDSLLIHAATVAITVLLPVVIEGWTLLLFRGVGLRKNYNA